MLHPNNSQIDFAALETAIERTARYGRHAAASVHVLPVMGEPRLTLKQRVRSWPVAGPVLASLYHRLRLMRAPGVDWRQRVRATPVLGELTIWLYALATLPRWRRALQDELAQAQQQLGALRHNQAELSADLESARRELHELQNLQKKQQPLRD